MDRKGKSLRNTMVGTFCHIFTLLIGFATRTVFIYFLGKNYLGVNGLFTNILSLLSFAELGIGTAIIYALYKPLADNDEKKVSALMNFYKTAYRCIGIFIALAGIVLTPFLDVLIKDKPDIPNLEVLYLLVLTNTVVSYFFTYKRSIIIASQNSYINSLNTTLFTLLQNILQIIVLVVTRNYIFYLVTQICTTLLSNISISYKADKLFPYLKENKREHIEKTTLKSIIKNVVAMMCSKLGSVVVSGTDNLLISAFVGVGHVALYSNYVLINNMINGVINQVFNAITASVGNLNAKGSTEHSYSVFKKIFFINFVMMCICSTCLFVLFNPFIKFWIGEGYLLNTSVVAIIVLNFFIYGIRQTAITYINTYGLFWQIKYKSIIEAAINLILSLLFLIKFDMGIYGVLLGTTCSTVLTNVWWEPYVVYKYKFNKSVLNYLITLLGYFVITCLICAVSWCVASLVPINGLVGVITKLIICLGLVFIIITIFFGKTENYKFFKEYGGKLFIKLRKKR